MIGRPSNRGDLPPTVVRASGDVSWFWSAARGRPSDKPRYFVITPQAIRSPALPAGSDFMSSGFAWMTNAVPPLTNREWSPSPKFTRGSKSVSFAVPSALTVSSACHPHATPLDFAARGASG